MRSNYLKLLMLVSIGLSASGALAQQSYPLVCRGGGGTLGFSAESASALFYFRKAAGPAGAGLSAGECSWVDRAVGTNEPTCLSQQGVQATSWLFPGQLGNSYFTSTGAPWLRSLLQAGTFQTFQVYNPGTGNCFVVRRLGP